eukprot:SAG11_NODE_35231_length_267_cov_1.446429_1_plen_33_part_01
MSELLLGAYEQRRSLSAEPEWLMGGSSCILILM